MRRFIVLSRIYAREREIEKERVHVEQYEKIKSQEIKERTNETGRAINKSIYLKRKYAVGFRPTPFEVVK